MISKKIILKNHKKTKTAHKVQRGEQKRKKKRKKPRTQGNQQRLITKKRTKEHRIESLEVSPQALDQSKRVPLK